MKIERISKTQVKFLITDIDLKEKNINLSEILTQSTPQARDFFRDIMKQAISEFDIDIDIETCSIIIEAMPISEDSIMIIVSKARDNNDFNEIINLVPASLTTRKFKQDDELKLITSSQNQDDETFFVYQFNDFETVCEVSLRIQNFKGNSILYKLDDKYYLVLESSLTIDDDLEIVLSEYGQKFVSNSISKYFLEEHGEAIIKQYAITILTSI